MWETDKPVASGETCVASFVAPAVYLQPEKVIHRTDDDVDGRGAANLRPQVVLKIYSTTQLMAHCLFDLYTSQMETHHYCDLRRAAAGTWRGHRWTHRPPSPSHLRKERDWTVTRHPDIRLRSDWLQESELHLSNTESSLSTVWEQWMKSIPQLPIISQ